METVRSWEKSRDGLGRVWLKCEPVTSSGRRMTSLKKRRRKVDYLSGQLTDKVSSLGADS